MYTNSNNDNNISSIIQYRGHRGGHQAGGAPQRGRLFGGGLTIASSIITINIIITAITSNDNAYIYYGSNNRLSSEKGEVLLRGVGTLRYFPPPNASVQWQPDGSAIPSKKWSLGAGILGAPRIPLISRREGPAGVACKGAGPARKSELRGRSGKARTAAGCHKTKEAALDK